MKNILFAASECAPYAKSGGLGDIISSLPKALNDKKHRVTVMLPLYEQIKESEVFNAMVEVAEYNTTVVWRNKQTRLFKYVKDGITYLFVDNKYYFGRDNLYGYFDDAERFIYFSNAIMDYLNETDEVYDVLHCHDWQMGSLVASAKILKPQPFKIVYTIHNIHYQGWFNTDDYDNLIELDRIHFDGFLFNGQMNLMKAAIFHADVVTTVSETYANEILSPFFGEGLENLLYSRYDDLYGVRNGLDTQSYDPNRDKSIAARYRTSRKSKMRNKLALQHEYGFEVSEDIPMYGLVTRLIEQKGIDLIMRIFEEFMDTHPEAQFVMVGNGEEQYEDYFRMLESKYPGRVRATIGFSEDLARKIYASSDFFLMPSLFEPCGLGQLIAIRYLTLPIVRETGGLRDTVTPFNEFDMSGNGFSFANYNAHDFLNVLNYSYDVFYDDAAMKALFANMKSSKLGWDTSADQYIKIYE
ncbi:MAG TPA: glycogen synthase [Aliicoccus persicus]|uniref:Glycogen synthase n=1 Tax=Aliicoccus persicus TaxID=930138 RepID=A0A921DWG2_9STAP|nr:glycogen synthase [Aliicoccus persicus]